MFAWRGLERKRTGRATPTVSFNFLLQTFRLVRLESIQVALFKCTLPAGSTSVLSSAVLSRAWDVVCPSQDI